MNIYINDIMVYSKTTEKHVGHLEYVLNKFWENQLFTNKGKNVFSQEKIDFLGHILSQEGVRPDPKKLGHMGLEKTGHGQRNLILFRLG